MNSFPYRSRSPHSGHPSWCYQQRCGTVGRLGEHRSEPVTVGPLVVTLTQQTRETTPRLNVRLVTRLHDTHGDAGAWHAYRLLAEITAGLAAAQRSYAQYTGREV